MNICVYGANTEETNEEYLDVCYDLGLEIANRGHTLISGGEDAGIMGAVACGVDDNQGKIIGIIPSWIEDFELLPVSFYELIETDSIKERQNKIVEYSDILIVSPGGIKTLDNFFEAIRLRKKGKLAHKIIVFNIDGFYDTLIEFFVQMDEEKLLNIDMSEIFEIVTDIDEIFEIIDRI